MRQKGTGYWLVSVEVRDRWICPVEYCRQQKTNDDDAFRLILHD